MIAAMLFATPVVADDDLKMCTNLSKIGREVMTMRQDDVPMSETLKVAMSEVEKLLAFSGIIEDESGDPGEHTIIINEIALAFTKDAYDRWSHDVEELKQRTINDFENEYFEGCYSESISGLPKSQSQSQQLDAERLQEGVDAEGLAVYTAMIRQKIERNWSAPASAHSELECSVRVNQVPGGEVTGVTILSCNGDDAVKRSVEAAIYRSSPLPEPSDPSLFDRNILLNLRIQQ